LLQAIVLCSKKKFEITKQGDSGALLPWILNSLHMALGEISHFCPSSPVDLKGTVLQDY
jgi:hypothetical protein